MAEVAASLGQPASELNTAELTSLTPDESAEVMQRFFGNLIESKESEKKQHGKIRELEERLLKQKAEIATLRKRQSKMKSWSEHGVDVSMACLNETQAEKMELDQLVQIQKAEIKDLKVRCDKHKAAISHARQEEADRIAKLTAENMNYVQEINALQAEKKKWTVRARMEGAREEQAQQGSQGAQDDKLEKAHRETEQAWLEKMAETERADAAETRCNEYMCKLRKKEKELRFLKGQNMNEEVNVGIVA